MSQILVGHLASYEGMGRARVQCVSGCKCEESVLDGWWERHASLQVMHTIMVRRGGCAAAVQGLFAPAGH